MRTLYFYIVILILTNTANGFDGKSLSPNSNELYTD
jgi:hypothetical protein